MELPQHQAMIIIFHIFSSKCPPAKRTHLVILSYGWVTF